MPNSPEAPARAAAKAKVVGGDALNLVISADEVGTPPVEDQFLDSTMLRTIGLVEDGPLDSFTVTV